MAHVHESSGAEQDGQGDDNALYLKGIFIQKKVTALTKAFAMKWWKLMVLSLWTHTYIYLYLYAHVYAIFENVRVPKAKN